MTGYSEVILSQKSGCGKLETRFGACGQFAGKSRRRRKLTHIGRTDDVLIVGRLVGLFGAEEGVAEEEERAEHPDERADFAVSSGAEFDEGEGEETEAETRGDTEGEGRGY